MKLAEPVIRHGQLEYYIDTNILEQSKTVVNMIKFIIVSSRMGFIKERNCGQSSDWKGRIWR